MIKDAVAVLTQLIRRTEARLYCSKDSLEALKSSLDLNHSIGSLRVNNVLANMPEFAEAFHCAPGTRMNPDKRCTLY
ncbi:hypothetical protein Y032_0607g588 [Ancylostoma ceylanicum]|uniref:Peptidase M13 C-terminal domain-containing protein n=1 Tax=Ancylostoma ceylanicum TaxID=53326 RepID=A0A016WLW6_9BILA|nr:hypothetical protein Y032_0607g588 [Ancylostoma ceylanicum]